MASKTIELHDVNVPEFLKELDSCKGNVYLVVHSNQSNVGGFFQQVAVSHAPAFA